MCTCVCVCVCLRVRMSGWVFVRACECVGTQRTPCCSPSLTHATMLSLKVRPSGVFLQGCAYVCACSMRQWVCVGGGGASPACAHGVIVRVCTCVRKGARVLRNKGACTHTGAHAHARMRRGVNARVQATHPAAWQLRNSRVTASLLVEPPVGEAVHMWGASSLQRSGCL